MNVQYFRAGFAPQRPVELPVHRTFGLEDAALPSAFQSGSPIAQDSFRSQELNPFAQQSYKLRSDMPATGGLPQSSLFESPLSQRIKFRSDTPDLPQPPALPGLELPSQPVYKVQADQPSNLGPRLEQLLDLVLQLQAMYHLPSLDVAQPVPWSPPQEPEIRTVHTTDPTVQPSPVLDDPWGYRIDLDLENRRRTFDIGPPRAVRDLDDMRNFHVGEPPLSTMPVQPQPVPQPPSVEPPLSTMPVQPQPVPQPPSAEPPPTTMPVEPEIPENLRPKPAPGTAAWVAMQRPPADVLGAGNEIYKFRADVPLPVPPPVSAPAGPTDLRSPVIMKVQADQPSSV